MRRVLKVLAILAGIAVIGFYIVVKHSEAHQDLVCAGNWRDAPADKETAYVQLSEYRWWVGLWGSTHGNLKVQTDKRAMSDYISEVTRIHEGRLALYTFHDYDFNTGKLGKFRGGYRAANREIVIEFPPTSVFVGTCNG